MNNNHKYWAAGNRAQFEANVKELNHLPAGWVKSFVPALKDELFYALGNYTKNWIVIQATERYGEMYIYWTWKDENGDMSLTHNIENIIDKYRIMSLSTCVKCGGPISYYRTNYTFPLCENCK